MTNRDARLLLVVAALAGCSGPSPRGLVQAELVRLQTPPVTASRDGAWLRGGAGSASVWSWSSDLMLTSYQGPVSIITMDGPGRDVIEIYRCTGATSDECLVDLNGPALQNLIGTAPVAVNPGTYDKVRMIYCQPPETGYHSYIAASVQINGTTWYTRTAGNLATTGPAEPVRLNHAGCVKDYTIFPPLVVTDTAMIPIQLRLYFDVRDIGYAVRGDAGISRVFGFSCTPVVTLGVTPFVCGGYPDVTAVAGTIPPTEERYLVNGGALIGLLFDSSDQFVGGFFRRHLVDGMDWNPLFFPDAFVDGLTPNGDGSYRLHQVGGSTFPAFRRSTHSGTAAEATGTSFAYTAVRLP